MNTDIRLPRPRSQVVTGVCNPLRLSAVEDSGLFGDVDDVHLNAIVHTLQAACEVPIAVVNVVRPGLQTYPAGVGLGTASTDVPDHLSPCATIVDTTRSLVVPDLKAHPRFADNPFVRRGAIRAFAGEPLVDRGVVLGTIALFDDVGRTFSASQLDVLHHQAILAGGVLELRRSARTDPLTGLPNRRLVFDRLGQALRRLDRSPGAVAVLFIDVNDFKDVNDRYGHSGGDQLLTELARRLSGVLRRNDTLGRVGGDEFVLVCDVASEDDVPALRRRFLDALQEPVLLDGVCVPIRVSLGTASTTSSEESPSTLLREADARMYVEKQYKHRQRADRSP